MFQTHYKAILCLCALCTGYHIKLINAAITSIVIMEDKEGWEHSQSAPVMFQISRTVLLASITKLDIKSPEMNSSSNWKLNSQIQTRK